MLKVSCYALATVFIFSAGCAQGVGHQKEIMKTRIYDKASKIVLLNRKNEGLFEKNGDHLIKCLSKRLNFEKDIVVVDEDRFRDAIFPFFVSDEATRNIEPSLKILNNNHLQRKLNDIGIDYIVWLSEQTKYADKVGALSCSLGIYGGGCFGYTAQSDETEVRAEIWSVSKKIRLSNDTVTASGKSQLLAFIVPIPIPSNSRLKGCNILSEILLENLLDR